MSKLFVDGSKLLHHLDRVNDWKKGNRIAPIHVEISPTSACNQRCILCCVDYLHHKPSFLSDAIMAGLPLQLKEANVKSILLAGEGEPLLNPSSLQFLTECKKLGIDCAINSNGLMFTADMAASVLPSLTWARFSLQASNSDLYQTIHRGKKNDFDIFCNNFAEAVKIKIAMNLPVTLGIQQILINENMDDLFNTAQLARDLGADYYIVKRFSKHPKNSYDVPEDLYTQCLEQFKKIETLRTPSFNPIVRWNNFESDCNRIYKRCIGLPFIMQILASGDVYPCAQFFYRPEFSYGNLTEISFDKIVKSDRAKKIQETIENHQDVNQCMSYCRHHSTNQFLWELTDEPDHINFI